jgi:hypoxanthine phosphoribosyltransferase
MSESKTIPTPKEPPVFISEADIRAKVKSLAEKINAEFKDQELTVICTLKGSVIFFSDLIRELKMPVVCEFLGVSSYGNQTESTGEVKVTLDLTRPLNGKNVLLAEDIVDSGLTLSYLTSYLKAKQPATLKIASLLFKPTALKAKGLQIDYVGFEISNRFVVGYGMDYAEQYRGLPYIGTLD